MKPETEYIARQLAGLVLRDDGERGHLNGAGSGEVVVNVEMRGMVRTIRQAILVDHVDLAAKVADEIERQTAAVDIDAIIAEHVKAEVARARRDIEQTVRDAVKRSVESSIGRAVEYAARGIAERTSRAVMDAAFRDDK